jgi:uncharacterized protein
MHNATQRIETATATHAPQIRILQLDVMRGFAVLGIYWINVVIFGLPHGAYALPTLWGEAHDANLASWVFSELFVQGSMRGLFSMLFGASAMVFLDEARLGSAGLTVVDRYYRRNLLLILFGVIHAYLLLWPYDVLYAYGMFGLFLFPLRRIKPAILIVAGSVLLLGGDLNLNQVLEGFTGAATKVESAKLAAPDNGDQSAVSEPDSFKEMALLDMEADVEMHRAGYGAIFVGQIEKVMEEESSYIYTVHLYDIGGMMLIGMALLKLGVLNGTRNRRFYLVLALVGYAGGLLFRGIGVESELSQNFGLNAAYQPGLGVDYDIGRLPITLGHIGLIGLLVQSGRLKNVVGLLACAGRMSLTNYIMQTVVSIFLFYGFGFALFGQLEAYELIYVCLAVWTFQITFSHVWLRYYRQGPLEWIWRSLIYGKRQPLLRESRHTGACAE